MKVLSSIPTNTERRVLCQQSCSKGPALHKNLNWSVKHQTVITCGEPGEICKHLVCGVSLRPLLFYLQYITPKQNHGFSFVYREKKTNINQNELCKFRCLNLLMATPCRGDKILNTYTYVTLALCSFF